MSESTRHGKFESGRLYSRRLPLNIDAHAICDARSAELTVGFASEAFLTLHGLNPGDSILEQNLETALQDLIKEDDLAAFAKSLWSKFSQRKANDEDRTSPRVDQVLGSTRDTPQVLGSAKSRVIRYVGIAMNPSCSSWPYCVVIAQEALETEGNSAAQELLSMVHDQKRVAYFEGLAVSMFVRLQQKSSVEVRKNLRNANGDQHSISSASTKASRTSSQSSSSGQAKSKRVVNGGKTVKVKDSCGHVARVSEESPDATLADSQTRPVASRFVFGLKADNDDLLIDMLERNRSGEVEENGHPSVPSLLPCIRLAHSISDAQQESALGDAYFVVAPFLANSPCIFCTLTFADMFGVSSRDLVGKEFGDRFFDTLSSEPLPEEVRDACASVLDCAEKGVPFRRRLLADASILDDTCCLTQGELVFAHKIINSDNETVPALFFVKTASVDEVVYVFGSACVLRDSLAPTSADALSLLLGFRKQLQERVASYFWYSAPLHRQQADGGFDG